MQLLECHVSEEVSIGVSRFEHPEADPEDIVSITIMTSGLLVVVTLMVQVFPPPLLQLPLPSIPRGSKRNDAEARRDEGGVTDRIEV